MVRICHEILVRRSYNCGSGIDRTAVWSCGWRLFLAFPAIFPASASLIEKHEKEKKAQFGFDGTKRGRVAAGVDAAGAAMGTIGLMVFAVVSWKLLPQLPTWLTLFIATLAWAGTAAAAWMICRRRWRERHSGVPTQKHKELGA